MSLLCIVYELQCVHLLQLSTVKTYRKVAGMRPTVHCCRNIRCRCWQLGWRCSCSAVRRSECTAPHSTEPELMRCHCLCDKQLSYRRRTARRATLVNSCYVSRGMGVRKVSINKSDLQGHSRQWYHPIGRIWFPIRIPLQPCLYRAPFPRYYHLFSNILTGHVTWPWTHPYRG